MNVEAETTENKGVVKATEFKSTGDWINRLLDEHCATVEGATEAKEAVVDNDGTVLEKAVRGTKGKRVVDKDALIALAVENGITVKEYPNPGMYRMNIGNMLRARGRKQGWLMIAGVKTDAPGDFEVKLAPEKAAPAVAEDAA